MVDDRLNLLRTLIVKNLPRTRRVRSTRVTPDYALKVGTARIPAQLTVARHNGNTFQKRRGLNNNPNTMDRNGENGAQRINPARVHETGYPADDLPA